MRWKGTFAGLLKRDHTQGFARSVSSRCCCTSTRRHTDPLQTGDVVTDVENVQLNTQWLRYRWWRGRKKKSLMSVKRRRRADRGAWCCGIRGAKCSLLEDLRVPAARGRRFAHCETPAPPPELLPDSQSRAIHPDGWRERELHIRWWFDQRPLRTSILARGTSRARPLLLDNKKSTGSRHAQQHAPRCKKCVNTLKNKRRDFFNWDWVAVHWVVAWSVPRQHSTYTHLTACTSPSARMCLYYVSAAP